MSKTRSVAAPNRTLNYLYNEVLEELLRKIYGKPLFAARWIFVYENILPDTSGGFASELAKPEMNLNE